MGHSHGAVRDLRGRGPLLLREGSAAPSRLGLGETAGSGLGDQETVGKTGKLSGVASSWRTGPGLIGFIVVCVLIVWLLYLAVKVADHVGAWPFGWWTRWGERYGKTPWRRFLPP